MALRYAAPAGVVTDAFAWNGTAGIKWALTSGGTGGQAIPTATDDVIFDAATASASYTITRTVAQSLRSLTLGPPSSGTATFVNASNVTLGVGGLTIAASGVVATGWTGFIVVTGATNTLNTNGVSLSSFLVLNGAGSNVTLGSNFNTSRTVQLTVTGVSLLLNGKVLTCGTLTSVSGATINFGTTGSAIINATATGTVLSLAGSTTNPGSVTVNTGTFSTTVFTGVSSAVPLTLTSSSSAPTITFSGSGISYVTSLTLSGFTGTISNAGGLAVNSSFAIPTGLGGGSGGWTNTGSLRVNGTLVTNGRTLGGSLTNNGAFVTTTLGSDVTAASLSFTDPAALYVGTYTLSVGTITLLTADTTYPSIYMSGGRIVVTGSSAQDIGSATFGSGSVIEFTTAASRTLSGSGSANLTLINSAGTLTFTFGLTANTLQASTGIIQLAASQTTTVSTVTLSNSTLRSAMAGTPATISKASGTVNFTGMTFRDITATGGAVWNAYTSNGNVDGGGNTGINFSPTTTNSGNFFALLT